MKALFEEKSHGVPEFPFVVYPGNLPAIVTSYPLHWHEEMELIYVMSGKGTVTVQAERLTVQTGDIVLVLPHRVHSMEQLEDNTMLYFTVLFRPAMLGSRYTDRLYGHGSAFPAYMPKGDPLNEKIQENLLELILNRKKTGSEYELMIRSHLCAIVYHILHDRPVNEASWNVRSLNYERLKVILEYLQENFAAEISVEEASAMCGFSASHFMKLFRELTGTSFAQYVKNLRLENAAKLLRTTPLRISEIAEKSGFNNLPYFTRAFGSKYRVSPGIYRERSLEK